MTIKDAVDHCKKGFRERKQDFLFNHTNEPRYNALLEELYARLQAEKRLEEPLKTVYENSFIDDGFRKTIVEVRSGDSCYSAIGYQKPDGFPTEFDDIKVKTTLTGIVTMTLPQIFAYNPEK